MRPVLYLRESRTVRELEHFNAESQTDQSAHPDQPRSIKIPNLYGRYFAVCVNNRNSGAGAIQNS